jgi:hypothetical protein
MSPLFNKQAKKQVGQKRKNREVALVINEVESGNVVTKRGRTNPFSDNIVCIFFHYRKDKGRSAQFWVRLSVLFAREEQVYLRRQSPYLYQPLWLFL